MTFTNIKISISLNNLLSQEPLFQGEKRYKAIGSCSRFLEIVFNFSQRNKDGWAAIDCKTLDNLFRREKIKYLEVIGVLVRLEIIEPRKRGFFDSQTGTGSFARFKLTDYGIQLLLDEKREYLRKLHNDPKLDTRIRNSRRKKKSRIQDSEDLVISKTSRNILDLELNKEAFDIYWEKNEKTLSPEQKIAALYSLVSILTGGFKKLERCKKDGRIHHTWVGMRSDLRPLFTLRGKKYLRIIDLRSAHPTFWAKYIWDISNFPEFLSLNEDVKVNLKTKYKEYNNILTNNSIYTNSIYYNSISPSFLPPPPVSLHYLSYNVTKLADELIKWTEFWTNPDIDPKQQIINELGRTYSRDEIKEQINSSINGLKNNVFSWIGKNYPALFDIWNKTDLKKTGNNISRFYETKLMLDPELILLAESMGLDAIPEHDGLGIFAEENDSKLNAKVEKLREWIQEKSVALFGIKVQVKIDQPEVPTAGQIGVEGKNGINKHATGESEAKTRRKPIQNTFQPRNEAPF